MRGVILWSPTLQGEWDNYIKNRFNPLGRGMGIGGSSCVPPWPPTYSFNPLGRGMGIGGITGLLSDTRRYSVSIRLDAAWVLGGRGASLDAISVQKFQSAWTRHGYWGTGGTLVYYFICFCFNPLGRGLDK